MAQKSDIEWTQATWNPVVGCTKHSDGCKNCYAEPIALQLQKQGVKGYENGFKLTLRPNRLDIPLSWKKPRLIFVDSMCDLFHDDVPLDYIKQVFDIMHKADWHIYQILTKRAERMAELSKELNWVNHIMPGVTIESNKYRHRLDYLKAINAPLKWLSLEPLIAPIEKLDLKGISWVIAGGESGRNARPMNIDWIRNIRDWAKEQNVAFWFKQNSEHGCYGNVPLPILDEKTYKEFPVFKRSNDLFE